MSSLHREWPCDQVPQAFVLADGDGEADIHLTTGGDESVGVEAAVGPRLQVARWPRHGEPGSPFHAGSGRRPEGWLARPSRSRDISTSTGAGGDGRTRG